MPRETYSVLDPISDDEASVLQAYATESPTTGIDVDSRTGLVRRGLLMKSGNGHIVTPEGLAAILDTVPIQELEFSR